jgi:hypothetical protein
MRICPHVRQAITHNGYKVSDARRLAACAAAHLLALQLLLQSGGCSARSAELTLTVGYAPYGLGSCQGLARF